MTSNVDIDDVADGEFSELERKRLRRLLRDEDRAQYLWRTLRIWVGWGSAVLTGIYAGWDTIAKYASAFVRAASGHGQ